MAKWGVVGWGMDRERGWKGEKEVCPSRETFGEGRKYKREGNRKEQLLADEWSGQLTAFRRASLQFSVSRYLVLVLVAEAAQL